MIDTSKSSSHEQQNAEALVAPMVEEWLGCPLQRNAKVPLSEEVHIEPDLYAEKERVICEIYAHIGPLKEGQKHKVSQDILKMILLEKNRGTEYRKIIAVVDDKVEQYLNGTSFIAESIRQFGIEVKRFRLSEEVTQKLLGAQKMQVMRNI